MNHFQIGESYILRNSESWISQSPLEPIEFMRQVFGDKTTVHSCVWRLTGGVKKFDLISLSFYEGRSLSKRSQSSVFWGPEPCNFCTPSPPKKSKSFSFFAYSSQDFLCNKLVWNYNNLKKSILSVWIQRFGNGMNHDEALIWCVLALPHLIKWMVQ